MTRHYLNHAGTSFPKPDAVREAVARTLALDPSSHAELLMSCRQVVARRLGADPERLLFAASCTQALEVAITELPWMQGDVLVTSQLEHSALLRPAELLVRRVGVELRRVAYRPGVPFELDELERYLRDGRVRLVAVSAASNVTGERLPVKPIADIAHCHGALLLVDAAQTFGLVDDTVRELGCDLLCFAGHKNPLGPQGIGGLWASPDVDFASERVACTIGGQPPGGPAMPGYCDVGGVNLAGLAGLAAGLEAFGEERAERMRRARTRAGRLATFARHLEGVEVFGHHGGPQTAVVSLRAEALPLANAEDWFRRRGLFVRAARHCAPDALAAIGAPEGTIRISFGASSSEDDYAAVVTAVESLGA